MNDRPTAEELLEAVSRFLDDEVVPALDGAKKYQARVAANVVKIVAREMACQDRHLQGEWSRQAALLDRASEPPRDRAALRDALQAGSQELVDRIRAGDADEGPWRDALIAHLRQTVDDKLEVAKPPRG